MRLPTRNVALGVLLGLGAAAPARAELKPVPILLDAAAAPDLKEWGDRARQICQAWYPVIKDLLPGDPSSFPAAVKIILDPVIEGGIPAYCSGAELHVNSRYVREQMGKGNSDFGMMVHELTHTVQRYGRAPSWLVEGIADYVRYERYEPTAHRRDFDPDKESYDKGYWVTSGFLAWIEQNHEGAFVEKLHRALTSGTYDDGFFEKTTGKTLPVLWKQFAQLRKQLMAVRPLLAAPLRRPAPASEAHGATLESTLAQARQERRPLILYFGAAWCGPCRQVEAYLNTAAGKAAVARIQLVHYDVDSSAGKLVEGRYPGSALPRFVAVDFSGRELGRTIGWSSDGGHPEFFGLMSLALEKNLGVDELVGQARRDAEDTALQLAAGCRLVEANRSAEARSFLGRASASSADSLAARALWTLSELDLDGDAAGADPKRARKQAELLLERYPSAPESLTAFRWLATASDPPRARINAFVTSRLQPRAAPAPDLLSELLLYSLRAGATDAAGQVAARLESLPEGDARRMWLLAEAAHARRNQSRALQLGRKALVLADSRLGPRLDRELERYRKRDGRPSPLLAALIPTGGPGAPPPWPLAFERLPRTLPARPDLKMGLLAQWRFDESKGMAAADSSGKGNTGVLLGFSDEDRASGHSGRALAFESSRRTTVMVRNSEFLNPREQITVAAWVKASDWTGNRRILQKGVSDNQYRLTAEGGELKFEVATQAGRFTAAGPLPAKDAWAHVAGTYDGKKVRLLVNGAEIASIAASGGPLAVTANPLAIGCKTADNDVEHNCFRGSIDDVSVYDRALTDRELSQLAGAVHRS
jgi:thiol-disulfide isomerase/thioredoxin